MTKHELVELLTVLEIRPSTRLGQNFLVDPNLLDAMVRESAPSPGERILEIGPGTGVLTRRLIEEGAAVTAVEYDCRLAEYLRQSLGSEPVFRLVEADACRTDFSELMGSAPYRCIANLPYSCSSVLITRLIDLPNPPGELYILLQREMAERLVAVPGTKDYGALSVRVQTLYDARIVRRIPPQVFYPPPDVHSAYLRMVRRPDGPPCRLRTAVARVARAGFAQRRKRLANSLAREFDALSVEDALTSLRLDPNVRAEALTPDQFLELARRLA